MERSGRGTLAAASHCTSYMPGNFVHLYAVISRARDSYRWSQGAVSPSAGHERAGGSRCPQWPCSQFCCIFRFRPGLDTVLRRASNASKCCAAGPLPGGTCKATGALASCCCVCMNPVVALSCCTILANSASHQYIESGSAALTTFTDRFAYVCAGIFRYGSAVPAAASHSAAGGGWV